LGEGKLDMEVRVPSRIEASLTSPGFLSPGTHWGGGLRESSFCPDLC
jgi:hypothetical protein